MQTKEIFDTHKKNPTLALLRQRTLPFTVACLQRAFADVTSDDVTEPTLKKIISDVQDEVFEHVGITTFDGEPDHYIDEWSKVAATAELDRPWLATRMSPTGQRIFTLLPSASEVLGFFDGLEISREHLTNSALNEYIDKVLVSASRLSGNVDHRKEMLLRQKAEIEEELERLEKTGLPDLDDFERAEIASSVSNLMSQITTAFRGIPGQIRKHNAENREIYHTATGPKHEILAQVAGRNKEKRSSPSFRVVQNLYKIRRDKTLRAQFEGAQSIIEHECSEHLNSRQVARMKIFLDELAQVGHDVYREDSKITQSQLKYIQSSSFRELREESSALRDAQEMIVQIRERLEPSPGDRRLSGIGIAASMPLKFPAMVDLKLATSLPVEVEGKKAADEVSAKTDQRVLDQTIAQAQKGLYLSTPQAKKRIAEAMAGRDSVRLSEVIKKCPLQYGGEEISNYLALAGGSLPSRYIIGQVAKTVLTEGTDIKVTTFPDPLFLKSGASAQGIMEFIQDLNGRLPSKTNNARTEEELCNEN